jgi:protein dithiol oxidoreductase (disulfide-forming)
MKHVRSLVFLFLSLAIAAGSALGAEGEEFSRLPKPQPVDATGKIEVIEFFWYGCPHCSALEPSVEAWEKQLPKDVAFRREHVVWPGRKETETHARLFLTLRAMGLLNQHHRAVFEAMQAAKTAPRSDKEIIDWAAKRGIDRAKFEATYKSFGVNTQLARARDLTNNYLADSVPSFAVNGKYYTSLGATRGEKRLFEVLNKLIADERPKK